VEDLGALIVAIICCAVAVFAISRVADAQEKHTLLLLFLSAFALRSLFTVVLFSSGLIDVLGGADDTGWLICWKMSRVWHGWGSSAWFGDPITPQAVFNERTFPSSLADVYLDSATHQTNGGFAYLATWFYYLLDLRSQLALAIFNGFLNAITVLIIYMTAREFFGERASRFAAMAAIILPSFFLFSALTIKETWVMLLEIGAFYATLRFSKTASPPWGLMALVAVILLYGLRFYAAWIVAVAALCIIASYRFRLSARILLKSLIPLVLGLFLLYAGGIDAAISPTITDRLHDAMHFRDSVAMGGPQWGTNSGVVLNYDLLSIDGLIQQIAVGALYVLLAPFPWQALSSRQIYAVPDILVWWGLCLGFVIPGCVHLWRSQPKLWLALAMIVVPLILLYSVSFGNVGLAHRQRAQLIPFFLVIAAASYERRVRKNLKTTPAPSNALPSP
jgi:hypothetical protein